MTNSNLEPLISLLNTPELSQDLSLHILQGLLSIDRNYIYKHWTTVESLLNSLLPRITSHPSFEKYIIKACSQNTCIFSYCLRKKPLPVTNMARLFWSLTYFNRYEVNLSQLFPLFEFEHLIKALPKSTRNISPTSLRFIKLLISSPNYNSSLLVEGKNINQILGTLAYNNKEIFFLLLDKAKPFSSELNFLMSMVYAEMQKKDFPYFYSFQQSITNFDKTTFIYNRRTEFKSKSFKFNSQFKHTSIAYSLSVSDMSFLIDCESKMHQKEIVYSNIITKILKAIPYSILTNTSCRNHVLYIIKSTKLSSLQIEKFFIAILRYFSAQNLDTSYLQPFLKLFKFSVNSKKTSQILSYIKTSNSIDLLPICKQAGMKFTSKSHIAVLDDFLKQGLITHHTYVYLTS